MPPHLITLASEIRDLRVRAQRTAADVARHLKIARQSFHQWENAQSLLPVERLGELLKLYEADDATMLRLFKMRAGI